MEGSRKPAWFGGQSRWRTPFARGPGCRTALICLRYRCLPSPCARRTCVRALPVSPSEQGKCGHILFASHSQPSTPRPARAHSGTHRSRAPTRRSGAREASCIVVKPSHLMESTKETRYQGQRGVRASETSRFHATPCPIWPQSWLYAMPLIGGLALQARWSSASSAGRSSICRVCASGCAGLGEGESQS